MLIARICRGLALSLVRLVLLVAFAFPADAALVYSNRYRSPRNPERKLRRATTLVVLHTTEGGARGSLAKVCERGECHFCVTEDGTVYRIVDREREAFHAGRSMWCGREDCDEYSVGIEVVGHHDKPVTKAQIDALRELIADLQRIYKLSDDRVVCHSHVAYGAPNKWQRRRHRGRKRCGMLFAMPSVRRMLGLKTKPGWDPDVRAGRLVQADPYLNQVLYGRVDTMVGRIGAPGGGGFFGGISKLFGSEKPPATTPAAAKKPAAQATWQRPAWSSAKPSAANKKATPKKGASQPKGSGKASAKGGGKASAKSTTPKTLAELKALKGYSAGVIGPGKTAKMAAGLLWQSPDTFYWTRGKVVRGNAVEPQKLEKGAMVFFRK